MGVPDDCNTLSKFKKHCVQHGPPFVPQAFYTAFRQPVTVFNQMFAELESVVWDRDAFHLQFFWFRSVKRGCILASFVLARLTFASIHEKTFGDAANQNCETILRTVLIHMLCDRICVASDFTSHTDHKQALQETLSQFLLLESRARDVSS